jgi:hypothetical protein
LIFSCRLPRTSWHGAASFADFQLRDDPEDQEELAILQHAGESMPMGKRMGICFCSIMVCALLLAADSKTKQVRRASQQVSGISFMVYRVSNPKLYLVI